MSDYIKTYDGAAKDAAESAVAGADFDTEFSAIETAIGTKPDKVPSPTANQLVAMDANGDLINGQTLLLNAVYPVGAIYMSTANTSPQAILGGTWTAIQTGRVLISEDGGTNYTAGDTGGSEDAVAVNHGHTATFAGNALPAHNHDAIGDNVASGGAGDWPYFAVMQGQNTSSARRINAQESVSAGTPSGSVTVNNLTGETGVGKNMQPYLAVYMWKRTA